MKIYSDHIRLSVEEWNNYIESLKINKYKKDRLVIYDRRGLNPVPKSLEEKYFIIDIWEDGEVVGYDKNNKSKHIIEEGLFNSDITSFGSIKRKLIEEEGKYND